MKKIILFLILVLSTEGLLFTQCRTPDTTKVPLSRYVNAYAYFTGNDTGCFMRTRYIPSLTLDTYTPLVIDTFDIKWKMKIRQVSESKKMYIFGNYDPNTNHGWYLSFNIEATGWIAVTFDNTSYKLDSIGLYDSTWHDYQLCYSPYFTTLKFIRDGSVKYNFTKFRQVWLGTDTNYCFCIGYRYAKDREGVPSDIPLSSYYFNGYIDYLKIFTEQVDGSNSSFNWNFNEGAGQYVYDSLDYKVYDATHIGYPMGGYYVGRHLQSGLGPTQDKYDIVWFNELPQPPTLDCPFQNVGIGFRFWNINPGYQWAGTMVMGMTVWNNYLVATGTFNRINAYSLYGDNGSEVSNVALWSSTSDSWAQLSNNSTYTAIGGYVTTATSFNGDLVVAGQFITAGGNTVNNITRWNGTRWTALDSGVDQEVYALKEWNGNLYVGGHFEEASGKKCKSIAIWNDSTWITMDTLKGNYVWAIEVYNDTLYIGGSFISAYYPETHGRGIAKWTGSKWDWVGGGGLDAQGCIRCMCVYNNELWVGGDFTSVAGITCNGIAKYNSSTGSWSALGSGVNNGIDGFGKSVRDMKIYNGDLYLTGTFYYMNGIPVNKICMWDSSQFCAISNGLDQSGKRMAVYDNELYIGGNFFSADGKDFNNILKFSSEGKMNRSSIEVQSSLKSQNYPNPFNPVTTIKYLVPKKGLVTVKVYDIIGREVKTLVNEILDAGSYSVIFDGTNFASGVYFYKIATGNYSEVRKMVLLK